MKINNKEYLPFLMKDIFKITKGKRLTKENMIEGNLNFLGAISDNNGVREQIEELPTHKGNLISVNYNGSVGESFYQKNEFWASDDVNVLELKGYTLNRNIALFLCSILKLNKWKFNYGRKWTLDKMNSTIIYLPVTNTKNPDWEYMDNFIGKLYSGDIKERLKTNINKKNLNLNIEEWKEFKIKDLFIVKKSKNINNTDIPEGKKYPYVTRTAKNNGVEKFTDTEEYDLNKKNAIIIGGESAYSFYQEKDFYTGNNITLIYNDNLNKYNSLFITTILNKENYKYSYGRAWNKANVENTLIRLPSDRNGNPDWKFMENYIKSLPYSDKI
ncbi:restriction endonuclease subunit S [Fusobacterium varium]|uniref:restriction endonuclease subunit S n=1 Tax=Fusobacterium varium TaxID=856 RepID=UPI00266CB943|nr:restriction endonuclease subunit S [Fusobacterium varium]